MVALYHAYVYREWGGLPGEWSILRHSWLFVDLFFVISGFVMTAVYHDALVSRVSVVAYMVRRFYRLYPLHIVTTVLAIGSAVAVQLAKLGLLSLGISTGITAPFELPVFDAKLFILDLLLLQGVGIVRLEMHNVSAWSISVEFWMYLLFAVLFFLLRARWARILVSIAIVAACLVHFASHWAQAGLLERTLNVWGMPRGLLSFFQGVLVFHVWQAMQAQRAAKAAAAPGNAMLSVLQLIAVAVSLCLVASQSALGTSQLVIPTVFGLLVLSLLSDRGLVADALMTRPCQWLGKYSYAIYLTHVAVQNFLNWPGRAVPEPWKHLVALLFVALVFGASMLCHRTIEVPWRERGKRVARRIEARDPAMTAHVEAASNESAADRSAAG